MSIVQFVDSPTHFILETPEKSEEEIIRKTKKSYETRIMCAIQHKSLILKKTFLDSWKNSETTS